MMTAPIVTYILFGFFGIVFVILLTLIGSALGISFFLSLVGAIALTGIGIWLALVFYTEPPVE